MSELATSELTIGVSVVTGLCALYFLVYLVVWAVSRFRGNKESLWSFIKNDPGPGFGAF